MPIITDPTTALDRLTMNIQPDVCPTLTPDEVNQLLDKNEVCSVWIASTIYEVNDLVIPTTNKRNGHKYRCIGFDGNGVRSGATEPDWLASFFGNNALLGPPIPMQSRFVDGNVVWEEAGTEVDFWDLARASYEGWMLKAAKASPKTDFSAAGIRGNLSQQYDQCIRQANRYLPVGVA